MKEADRIERNQGKLKELFPTFAARVKRVIEDLEAAGVRPRIQAAYRSPEDQLKAHTSGTSKLKFGFHNITGPAGEKQALAVDVLDDDAPLQPTVEYLLRLAATARKHGLVSGVLWGLTAPRQKLVNEALAAKNFKAAVKVGWDPTHLEPTGITVAEAKAGKRPA